MYTLNFAKDDVIPMLYSYFCLFCIFCKLNLVFKNSGLDYLSCSDLRRYSRDTEILNFYKKLCCSVYIVHLVYRNRPMQLENKTANSKRSRVTTEWSVKGST